MHGSGEKLCHILSLWP